MGFDRGEHPLQGRAGLAHAHHLRLCGRHDRPLCDGVLRPAAGRRASDNAQAVLTSRRGHLQPATPRAIRRRWRSRVRSRPQTLMRAMTSERDFGFGFAILSHSSAPPPTNSTTAAPRLSRTETARRVRPPTRPRWVRFTISPIVYFADDRVATKPALSSMCAARR